MVRFCKIILKLFIPVAMMIAVMQPQSAFAINDGDYPFANYHGPQSDSSSYWWTDVSGGGYSPYGFAYRNCTDFVAWKLATVNGYSMPVPGGKSGANDWGAAQHNGGFSPTMTPAPGAVAWWNYGTYGHVAWVEAVSADGASVTVQEYNNPAGSGAFNRRTIAATSVSGYIHFKDIAVAKGPGAADSRGFYQGLPPNGLIIENEAATHWYVAIGGSLVWFDRSVEPVREALLRERDRRFGWMNTPKMTDMQIHSIEYGFGGPRLHLPSDNVVFYEVGSEQQYIMQYGYAFRIGSPEEVAFLGGTDQAVAVPPGISAQLEGIPTIPNDVLLDSTFEPWMYHVVNGAAFRVDNPTVEACVQVVKGGARQPVPLSLMVAWRNAGLVNELPTSCSFPPDWVMYGPGGQEQWRLDGANPYSRRQYTNVLAAHCLLGVAYRKVQLPTAEGINRPYEGEPINCPDNSLVRIIGNGEVFRVNGNTIHHVPDQTTLTCLTGGNYSQVVDIDGAVVATTPRGPAVSCKPVY